MHVSTPRRPLALVLAAALIPALACGAGDDPPADPVEIHAHRGGPLATVEEEVVPVHPENSLAAFMDAHADGYVVELDVKLTRDRVPVVMHDPTLNRTTDCRGRVDRRTAAELDRCRLDVLGTADVTAPNPRPERVPMLAEVLDWARADGARLNLEIKNLPANDDFDPTRRFARAVVTALEESGIGHDQVLVQSFWRPNLDVAQEAGWRTAILTGGDDNRRAPELAERGQYDAISPEWPLPLGFLDRAAGRPVIVWTLNAESDIEAALDAGVAAIVSDNPGLVRALAAEG